MTFTISKFLALVACVIFVLAALAVPILPPIQFVALGLACLAAGQLVP